MRPWTFIVLLAAIALAVGGWFVLSSTSPFAGAGSTKGQEICSAALAGSNTIGERLAPSMVSAYMTYNGFEVSAPQPMSENEVRILGVRGDQHCTVRIRSEGSSHAFDELLADTAVIGMSSRPIKPAEAAQLRAAKAGVFAPDSEAEHVIALDGIAIIVHPSNPLASLAKEDVRRIFSGKIADWKEISPSLSGAIALHARDDASGTFQFFFDHVLQRDSDWAQAAEVARRYASSSELANAVAADPLAIGFVGEAYVTDGVKALAISDGGPAYTPTQANVRSESYPISRRLYLYVRPETLRTDPFAASLIRYFKSAAGYDIVEKLGYTSLRPTQAMTEMDPDSVCQSGSPEGEVYRRATNGAQRLTSVIRFGSGETLDSLARDDVDRLLEPVKQALEAGAAVTLIGHYAGDGDAQENRKRALDRADRVRMLFESKGAMGLQIESAGEACPVANSRTDSGKRTNQRVEIWIRK